MKYDFIKIRLSEIGKTQTEFAEAIGTTQSKLNVTLNHPELREFQIPEIIKAAEFLGYSAESFIRYVAGDPEKPTLNEPNSEIVSNISAETMVDILAAIDDFLTENNLFMSQEQRKKLLKHFCKTECHTAGHIKETLSTLQAVNSEIFTKGK